MSEVAWSVCVCCAKRMNRSSRVPKEPLDGQLKKEGTGRCVLSTSYSEHSFGVLNLIRWITAGFCRTLNLTFASSEQGQRSEDGVETSGRADTTDFITRVANAVGNKNRDNVAGRWTNGHGWWLLQRWLYSYLAGWLRLAGSAQRRMSLKDRLIVRRIVVVLMQPARC